VSSVHMISANRFSPWQLCLDLLETFAVKSFNLTKTLVEVSLADCVKTVRGQEK